MHLLVINVEIIPFHMVMVGSPAEQEVKGV